MSRASPRERNADKPANISWQGWKEIVQRVRDQLLEDHVQVVAAGVAFYFFLALFPALAAGVSLYGLVVSPEQLESQMSQIATLLPREAYQMIGDVLNRLTNKSDSSLGWSLLFSTLISLYSAKKGIAALFQGLNIVYHERDNRGFLVKNGIQLLFTFGAIITGILAIALIAIWPALVGNLELPAVFELVISWGRWLLLGLIIFFSLGLMYKVAPNRHRPEFRWVSWGAILAAVLWLGGSLLFSWYVNNFGNFDSTYGSFAAVIILMLWFFLTAFIILLGAEVNSEMEHQTRQDTTVDDDQPMGKREAYYADRVAGQKGDNNR